MLNIMKKIFIFSAITILVLLGVSFSTAPKEVSAAVCSLSPGPGETLVFFNEGIIANGSLEDATTSFKKVDLAAGRYKIRLESYDDHQNKPDQDQHRERWVVEFWNGNSEVAQSNAINDLLESRNYRVETVNSALFVPTTTKVRALHAAYSAFGSHSVTPVCALFSPVEINTTDQLSGSCSVSPSNPEVGDTVSWSASVSGGTGNFSYNWSGTDNLSGTSQTVSKNYNSQGLKNSSVTITSGTQSITRNCSVFVDQDVQQDDDLKVSCIPDGGVFDIDERVTWQAIVSGGDGNYTYDWSGTDGLDGNSRRESISYDDDGTKRANVFVRSGDGQVGTASCSIFVEEEDDDDFDVTCKISDTRIEEGDRVTIEVDIDGGNSPFDIEWDGDVDDIDDFDDNDRRQTVRIDDEGRYDLEVEVRDDDGRRRSDECRTIIVRDDDDDDDVSVSVTSFTGGTTGRVAGVALSQVPYTGLTDNPVLNAILYSLAGLTLLVIGSVSIYILRRREIVPAFAGSVENKESTYYTEDEIVESLEDVAFKKRTVISVDAIDTIMLRSKHNKVKALMLLNKAITKAKENISDDAWIVISRQKIADIL